MKDTLIKTTRILFVVKADEDRYHLFIGSIINRYENSHEYVIHVFKTLQEIKDKLLNMNPFDIERYIANNCGRNSPIYVGTCTDPDCLIDYIDYKNDIELVKLYVAFEEKSKETMEE